jgi:DNA primase
MLLPQSHDPDSLIREEGLDKFVERIQTARALSDYFFEHVSEELNLSEMEGRAQLISKAKPYLEKLPEGVFKEMMFARLKELSRVMTLNVLDNVAAVGLNLKKPRQQELNRLSSARVAIALLLQNPRLADSVEQKDIDWSGLEFRGIELFKNILQVILDKKSVNTAVLVEYYRDSVEEKSVKALALLDVFVSDDKIEEVFGDALKVLLKQGREAGIARLQAKAQSKGLDSQEQDMLVKMLVNK